MYSLSFFPLFAFLFPFSRIISSLSPLTSGSNHLLLLEFRQFRLTSSSSHKFAVGQNLCKAKDIAETEDAEKDDDMVEEDEEVEMDGLPVLI